MNRRSFLATLPLIAGAAALAKPDPPATMYMLNTKYMTFRGQPIVRDDYAPDDFVSIEQVGKGYALVHWSHR